MDKLKELAPILAFGSLLLWAMWPELTGSVTVNKAENPLDRLHRTTTEARKRQAIIKNIWTNNGGQE